jgi:shikimate kinase
MNLKLKRSPGIYLVGFMGSGKTTIGRMLADEIGWRFVDLDDEIENEQRSNISDLFARLGEAEFRRIEREAVRKRVMIIRRGIPMVVALGGGAFAQPEIAELLTDNGVTIWIDAPLQIVKKRVALADHRPLARDPVQFEQLYEKRRQFYAKADFRIELTEDSSKRALADILKLPLFH